jgi:hypothetical protein
MSKEIGYYNQVQLNKKYEETAVIAVMPIVLHNEDFLIAFLRYMKSLSTVTNHRLFKSIKNI